MEGQGVGQFDRYYGKGLESLFPEGSAGITTTPMPKAAGNKLRKSYDENLVHAALSAPEQTVSHIDPRSLRSTQSSVTRAGVSHYMGDEYSRTGRTFADPHEAGNRMPVIYSRPKCPDCDPSDPEHLILSGHHRAVAAMLKGEQLAHIRVEGGWGGPR